MSYSLSQLAYEYLQQQLLAGRMSGGDKVSELAVARDLGISRTPVREAIRRLQSEGLLYQIASSGTYVTEPDSSQIVDAFEIRLVLELYLVRRSVAHLPADALGKLARFVQEMRDVAHEFRARQEPYLEGSLLEKLSTTERAFHACLLAGAENNVATRFFNEIETRLRIHVQQTARLTLSELARTVLSYHRIAVAAAQGNCNATTGALEAHLVRRLRCSITGSELESSDVLHAS